MKRVRIALRAIAVLVSMLASASPAQTATPAPRVVVGLEPQSYLVERLAGNAVEITVLIEAGRSPHTYEPSPREVAEISRAAVLVTSGMPFEKNLIEKIRALRPDLRVVPAPVQIRDEGAAHTPHDPEHAGCADGDPHFWLDPGVALEACGAHRR
ncbi:MAG: zinc ABC transporter solute-binding protein [Acidobacteria bacterium]|nr:zinc ABC transporter solute-binding protein [Acidobacteriota bacterium]